MTITRVTQTMLLLAGLLPAVKAQNFTISCTAMLKPVFDLAAIPNGAYSVYATFTKQYASQSTNQTYDPVHYANGQIVRHNTGAFPGALPYFQSDLPMQSNGSNFTLNAALTVMVYVREDGWVGIQEKINNIPIGGQPPTYFQGTCSNGLVTGTVGSTAYIISFTSQPFQGPK